MMSLRGRVEWPFGASAGAGYSDRFYNYRRFIHFGIM